MRQKRPTMFCKDKLTKDPPKKQLNPTAQLHVSREMEPLMGSTNRY